MHGIVNRTGSVADEGGALAAISMHPLFAMKNTGVGLRGLQPHGGNLYFGTGLSTTRALTRGLPFDYLSMICAAEVLRRELGLGKIIHEISDTHAIENGFGTAEEVMALARQQQALVTTMAGRLGLGGVFECVLASSYQNSDAYQGYLAEVSAARPDENHYFRYQWSGMRWLAEQRGVRVKLGWLVEDDDKVGGFDERRFDHGYDELKMAPLAYAYVFAGRSFTPGRTRVSPYTSPEGEDRIMLFKGEDAEEIFKIWTRERPLTKDTRLTLSQMAALVDMFEGLFGRIEGTEAVWLKAQENVAQGVVSVPGRWQKQGYTAINICALADKINGILASVFDLRPARHGFQPKSIPCTCDR